MTTPLQRIDAEIATFTESYTNLVKASRLETSQSTKAQGGRVAGDLLEVLAEKLVMSGQNLIHMIGELKRNAVVNDFSALNHHVADQNAMHDAEVAALDAKLSMLRNKLCDVSMQ